MNTTLRKVGSAMSPLALLVALLALVAASAGLGYAAGQIGTKDIKNNAITAKKIKKNAVTSKKIQKNAVTTDKIKDGSLTASDLVPNEVEHAATLSNGGEGDCVWEPAALLVPGAGNPAFRKDRFGTVHLSGLTESADGPGGDGNCDPSTPGQSADAVAFTLPAGYIPAKTQVIASGFGGVLIAGPNGLNFMGVVLPPGAVSALGGGAPIVLDGVSFEPAGSNVVLPKMTASGQVSRQLLQHLGIS